MVKIFLYTKSSPHDVFLFSPSVFYNNIIALLFECTILYKNSPQLLSHPFKIYIVYNMVCIQLINIMIIISYQSVVVVQPFVVTHIKIKHSDTYLICIQVQLWSKYPQNNIITFRISNKIYFIYNLTSPLIKANE